MLDKKEAAIIIHALTGGTKKVYRNLFVTGEGSTDWVFCNDLVERGFMKKYPHPHSQGDFIFQVTERGANAVEINLPPE